MDRGKPRVHSGRGSRALSAGVPMSRLELWPMPMSHAKQYIEEHHRHHKPPIGSLFALCAVVNSDLVGVVIVGRPVARMSDDGITAEVVRCCTQGHKNACSFLYGAAWRAARALGYRRLLTYTLPEEGGASLRASGWREDGPAGGGSWKREQQPYWQPRNGVSDQHPLSVKTRWSVQTDDFAEVLDRFILRKFVQDDEPSPQLSLFGQ